MVDDGRCWQRWVGRSTGRGGDDELIDNLKIEEQERDDDRRAEQWAQIDGGQDENVRGENGDGDVMLMTMRKNKSRTKDLEEGRSGVRQRSDMRIYFTMIRTDVYKKSIFEESFKLHLLLSLVLPSRRK